MDELMKKYEHLNEEMKRRIKSFISSKGIMDIKSPNMVKRKFMNLEKQIDAMIQMG